MPLSGAAARGSTGLRRHARAGENLVSRLGRAWRWILPLGLLLAVGALLAHQQSPETTPPLAPPQAGSLSRG